MGSFLYAILLIALSLVLLPFAIHLLSTKECLFVGAGIPLLSFVLVLLIKYRK